MELYLKIENKCVRQKEIFCEFLTCLYNSGLCKVSFDYKDEFNFCFHRCNDSFGINDLFVYFEDDSYFDYLLYLYNGAKTISIITPISFETEKLTNEWKVSVRRQFYKKKISNNSYSSEDVVLLNNEHTSMINGCTSDVVKNNYKTCMDFEEESFAIVRDQLECFLSTSKVEKANMLEVNWIYTEPAYRNKGCASKLLTSVSNVYIKKGILVTYHCNNENIASANTALKSGFIETVPEIILERK